MIIDSDFADHPKTVKLCRLLGPDAVRLLLRLWAHCQNRRTDQLPSDPEDIAAICRYDGPADQLVGALERCGWIDRIQLADQLPTQLAGWIAHGWRERNASWLAKIEGGRKRAKDAKRADGGQMQAKTAGFGSAGVPAGSSATSYQPAASQLAGEVAASSAGSVEWSGVENIPPIVPQGGQSESGSAVADPSPTPPRPGSAEKKEGGAPGVLEEAKKRIGGLFGRQALFFGHDAERALAELVSNGVLPLPEEDWQLLEWWFGLPKDERDSDLRNRRQHAETLACNLLAEIDRARGYAKKTGRAGVEKKTPEVDFVRVQQWHREKYPHLPVPRSWEEMPDYLQAEAKAALLG